MLKLSEPQESILNKERRCIRLANDIILSRYQGKSLLSDLRESILDPFKGGGLLVFPIMVLIAPLGTYDAVCTYLKREKKRNEIKLREKNHTEALRNVHQLWLKYGLSVDQFISEEHLISDCLSEWLEILFGKRYYYSSSEIIEKFNEESEKQGKVMNNMRNQGVRINLEHWRSVVVRNITQDAPLY